MKAKEFYDSVTQYLTTREGQRVGTYMIHPYSYNYGFSKVEEYEGKIVMWKGDLFRNDCSENSPSNEPSLPLSNIMAQLKNCIDKYGDLELTYEKGCDPQTFETVFESPNQFIVSYGNITPIYLE